MKKARIDQLMYEATSLNSSTDWLEVVVNGETFSRKVHPSVFAISPSGGMMMGNLYFNSGAVVVPYGVGCRSGLSSTSWSSVFNIGWVNNIATLWIDDYNAGNILTSQHLSVATPQSPSNNGSAGGANTVARSDHAHPMSTGEIFRAKKFSVWDSPSLYRDGGTYAAIGVESAKVVCGFSNSGATISGYCDVYGRDFYINGAVKATSDERLKRDIVSLSASDGLSKVHNLAVAGGAIRYRFVSDPLDAPMRLGLSAQAVAANAEYASASIDHIDGETYLGWDVMAMIALLVHAVGDLASRHFALTALSFIRRFTDVERQAIRARCRVNDSLGDWWDQIMILDEVDVTDSFITDGMATLVDLNLLTSARASEIMA